MSQRSIYRVAAVLSTVAMAISLGACAGPSIEWSAPGWYLEQPRVMVAMGPQLFAGPFTYDKCEEERLKATTPGRMLCINEKAKPPLTGPY